MKTGYSYLKKSSVLAVITTSILLGTLTIIPWEVAKNQEQEVKAAYLMIEPYPLLDWSKPKEAEFIILHNEGTSKEYVSSYEGEQSLAQSSVDYSSQIFSFYDEQLKKNNFVQKKLTNDPKRDKYWIASYSKSNKYFEIQYYPTPYEKNMFTTLVFFGMTEKEGESL